MTIQIRRVTSQPMRHTVLVRSHTLTVDELPRQDGNDDGPTPHDLYDAALGACKAMTVVWYARRKGIPLEDVEVTIDRDDSGERQGSYKLDTVLRLGGELSDQQRGELLAVAAKCPVHKLMTSVTTEISTRLA